jgi:hypothetical protein
VDTIEIRRRLLGYRCKLCAEDLKDLGGQLHETLTTYHSIFAEDREESITNCLLNPARHRSLFPFPRKQQPVQQAFKSALDIARYIVTILNDVPYMPFLDGQKLRLLYNITEALGL